MKDGNPFQRAQVEALLGQLLPEWGGQAACAAGSRSQGAVHSNTSEPWGKMFKDEVTTRPGVEYRWPADVLEALKVCARCPVRQKCLAYAYEIERHIVDEGGSGLETHDTEQALHAVWEEDDRRFGVYGGAPGAMRERFAHEPNRLERLEAWFVALARSRNWQVEDRQEEVSSGAA